MQRLRTFADPHILVMFAMVGVFRHITLLLLEPFVAGQWPSHRDRPLCPPFGGADRPDSDGLPPDAALSLRGSHPPPQREALWKGGGCHCLSVCMIRCRSRVPISPSPIESANLQRSTPQDDCRMSEQYIKVPILWAVGRLRPALEI